MNLSRKHGKHTWRRHKVACVSACRHRSAQPLKIKCILLLKKKKTFHTQLFILIKSTPFVIIMLCIFFLFWQNTQVLRVLLTFAAVLAGICVHPHLSFCFPRMHRAQIPSDDAVWHLAGSPRSTPIAAAKHLPSCGSTAVMSVTSRWRQSHTSTRTTCPDFSQDRGSKLQNLQSFLRHSRRFHRFTKPFYRSLKITSEAHIRVPSVIKFIFLTLSQGSLTNKSASQQRHFKIGYLILVKISKAAGCGSGGNVKPERAVV